MSEITRFHALVHAEVRRARPKHGPYNSAHEAFAVLYEEVDEFWDQVRLKREHRSRQAMLQELVQIAAVAAMAADELGCLDLEHDEEHPGSGPTIPIATPLTLTTLGSFRVAMGDEGDQGNEVEGVVLEGPRDAIRACAGLLGKPVELRLAGGGA